MYKKCINFSKKMDQIDIVDFGGQYTHLISKFYRKNNVYNEIYEWKSKLTGMKSAYLGVALLFIHTIAVMGGLTALFKWFLSGDK